MTKCDICGKDAKTTKHKLAVFEPTTFESAIEPHKRVGLKTTKELEMDFCPGCWKLIECPSDHISMGCSIKEDP